MRKTRRATPSGGGGGSGIAPEKHVDQKVKTGAMDAVPSTGGGRGTPIVGCCGNGGGTADSWSIEVEVKKDHAP